MLNARTPCLYGREKETALLHESVRALHNGGGAVLLYGEPGMGKTALLAEAARYAAESGVRVLTAVGVASEAFLPFAGLHQLLHPVRSSIGQLPETQRAALEVALGIRESAAPGLSLVAQAALELLARAAAHSAVLLVVDDVHWLDRASSDVLAVLARRLRRPGSAPVLLLAALREGCFSPLATAGVPGLVVGPLPAEASAALFDVRTPDLPAATRAALLREAAGHPLALTELSTTATAPVTTDSPTAPWPATRWPPMPLPSMPPPMSWPPMSRRLRDAVTSRLPALPAETRELLLIAACDEHATLTEILTAARLARPGGSAAAPLAGSGVSVAVPPAGSGVSVAVPPADSGASDAPPFACSATSDAPPSVCSATSDAVPFACSATSDAVPVACSATSDAVPSACSAAPDAVPSARSATSDAVPSACSAAPGAPPPGRSATSGAVPFTPSGTSDPAPSAPSRTPDAAPPDAEVSGLAPAVSVGVVDVDGDTVRFRQPLTRSAILQDTPADRRRAAHAALARCLPAGSDRRTRHEAAAATGPDERLALRLDETARRAARGGAADDCVTALEQAAGLSGDTAQRVDRLLRAAVQAVDAGRQDLVTRLLERAEPWAATPGQRARLRWIKGGPEDGMRDAAEGVAALTRLARTALVDGEAELAVSVLRSAALRCFWSDPGPAARHDIVALAGELPLSDTEPSLLAIIAHAQPLECGGRVLDRLRRAAELAAADPRAERLIGAAALLVGEFELARRLSRESVPGLRAEGRLGLLARALGAQAWSGAQLGRLTSAGPVAEEATGLARETGQPYLRALGLATEARAAALRGRPERALELAAAAERVALPVGARPVLATAQLARGLAAMGAGRFNEAYGHLRRMHDPRDPAYQTALRCYALIELTDAAVHCGERDSARSVIAGLERAAAQTPSPGLHSGLSYARAVLAEDTDAEGRFRAALDGGLCPWPFDRARLQLAYGQWLRRQRRAMDSRVQLRAARDAFDALGTVPWADRARRELLASGASSGNRRAPDARDRLTRQEAQIAHMAAEGLTNREIGQRLYLSHRTVSTHLHRVFPKLGIASRAELAASLYSGRERDTRAVDSRAAEPRENEFRELSR
ncbi:AAA family ATPase [Streptomyces sp. NPDC005811]|uniref:AAA family ATPase n=1 Tax=Streptomyces sp. NPDC005811 TaxID=3154565 RepID=UPI0033D93E6C